MTRLRITAKLTPEKEARVHELMRKHRYMNVDVVQAKLAKIGVEMSRATVHRSMQRLQRSDATNVLVVVVDRRTGETTTVSTGAEVPAVLAAIAALSD